MASGAAKQSGVITTAEVDDLGYARSASVAPGKVKQRVPLNRILIRDRLRWPTQAAKENLAVSFGESGQLQPILVRPSHSDDQGDWFLLVVGATRCGAAQICKWEDITAEVRVMSDDEALLAEIDENVVRPGLTPHERAVFIQARLKVWAKLNPDRVMVEGNSANIAEFPGVKRGRPKNSDKLSEFIGTTPPTMGFASDTAVELGMCSRTVERALTIARGLSADVHDRVANTRIAKNEGLLRQVAGVADKAEQLRVVEALLSEAAPSFSDALVIAAGRTPVAKAKPADDHLKAFQKLWGKATATERAAILRDIAGRPLPAGWRVVEPDNG